MDATNVKSRSRRPLLATARKHGSPSIAVVFDLPVEICLDRNRARAARSLPDDVIRRQHDQMKRSLSEIEYEGFDEIRVLSTATAVDAVGIAL